MDTCPQRRPQRLMRVGPLDLEEEKTLAVSDRSWSLGNTPHAVAVFDPQCSDASTPSPPWESRTRARKRCLDHNCPCSIDSRCLSRHHTNSRGTCYPIGGQHYPAPLCYGRIPAQRTERYPCLAGVSDSPRNLVRSSRRAYDGEIRRCLAFRPRCGGQTKWLDSYSAMTEVSVGFRDGGAQRVSWSL